MSQGHKASALFYAHVRQCLVWQNPPQVLVLQDQIGYTGIVWLGVSISLYKSMPEMSNSDCINHDVKVSLSFRHLAP